MIADNLKSVTQGIARCCEKTRWHPGDVKLICVTKEANIKEIEEVLALKVKDIGENRVQDALIKYRAIGDRAIWHLVGHLQTNKVKDAVKIFSLIHSIDSIRLAKEIDKEAEKINKVQDILVEVNTSGEESKFGITPNDIGAFFKEISLYPNINILGLMTIAPEVNAQDMARPCFHKLREIGEQLQKLKLAAYGLQLSMGMSNDFEVAIEEGSTMVRIGRAIFKND
ncbi:MAG: YggS family pyridoxal phosphate enzyme [Omnitrophica bacterium RIFCSPLOWO2_01_FULL_45_24]|nr:MAG: YggS family pyridoxal phosphate enzyme [Omnitrophica bacterium RIFCSPLOWO2_01_FULL_45_24]